MDFNAIALVGAVEPIDWFDVFGDPVRWVGIPGFLGSHYGEWVDMAAPGSQVLSTVPPQICSNIGIIPLFFPCVDEVNGYQYISGTSQAAPMVAGAATTVLAKHPDLTPLEVTERLKDSAKNMPYANLGAGALDVFEAVFNGSFELVEDDNNQPEEWQQNPKESQGCESLEEIIGITSIKDSVVPERNKRMLVCHKSGLNSAGMMNIINIPEGVTELSISFDFRIIADFLTETGLPNNFYYFSPKYDRRNVSFGMTLERLDGSYRRNIRGQDLSAFGYGDLVLNPINGWWGTEWIHHSRIVKFTDGPGPYAITIYLHSIYAGEQVDSDAYFLVDQFRFRES